MFSSLPFIRCSSEILTSRLAYLQDKTFINNQLVTNTGRNTLIFNELLKSDDKVMIHCGELPACRLTHKVENG